MARRIKLETIVENWLGLVMVHPDYSKRKRTPQYVERENQAIIIGYNRAQEDLRTLLREHGTTEVIRALAEVRADGQQTPIDVGGTKLWVMT